MTERGGVDCLKYPWSFEIYLVNVTYIAVSWLNFSNQIRKRKTTNSFLGGNFYTMFPGVHFLDALICKCKNKKNLHTKLSQNLELSPNHLWEKLYKKAIKNLCYLVVQVVHIFTKQISAFLVAWKIFVYNFVVITT